MGLCVSCAFHVNADASTMSAPPGLSLRLVFLCLSWHKNTSHAGPMRAMFVLQL